MDRQVFDDAIGASPKSTVDVEAIIARERRAGRYRWVANPGVAAGGAVLAVVFGVAVAVLPGQAGDSGGTIASPRSSSSTAPPSTISPPCAAVTRIRQPPTAPNTSESPTTAATRLTGVLAALIHAHSPDLRLTDRSWVQNEPHGPLSFQHVFSALTQVAPNTPGAQVSLAPAANTVPPAITCAGPADYFIAYANATDGMGTGSLLVTVARRGGSNEPITDCTKLSGNCIRSNGLNGEVIVTVTESLPTGGKSNSVSVSKPDGTAVSLSADNVPDSLKSANPASRPLPPLTLGQLTQIALDPGMTLYPHR
jgi:hypothetical protein